MLASKGDFNPKHTGSGQICPPIPISLFLSKNFPRNNDETLCKFLLYTYEESHNFIWSKKLSRGHVIDIIARWDILVTILVKSRYKYHHHKQEDVWHGNVQYHHQRCAHFQFFVNTRHTEDSSNRMKGYLNHFISI